MFQLTAHECICFQDGVLQRVYDIKVQRGNRGKVHSFLTSTINGVKWSVSLHDHFTPLEMTTDILIMGHSVVPTDSINIQLFYQS